MRHANPDRSRGVQRDAAVRHSPRVARTRVQGFGQTFELADERFWPLLGFQKSLASDRSMVKFTVNLCVIDKAQYSEAREEASYLSPKPTPNIRVERDGGSE